MSLADQIIEHGPYMGGTDAQIQILGVNITANDINELRDELITARAHKELLGQFDLEVDRWTDPIEVDLTHGNRCDWIIWFTGEFTLAELVQRATQHAEVCR